MEPTNIIQVKGNEYVEGMVAGEAEGKEFKTDSRERWIRTPTVSRGQGGKQSCIRGLEVWGSSTSRKTWEP